VVYLSLFDFTYLTSDMNTATDLAGNDDDDTNNGLSSDDLSIARLLRDAIYARDTSLHVSQINMEVSENGFLRLFTADLTFGSFGMPIAQYDTELRIVALTSFQPYDDDVLNDGEDVITLLTPIYRILKVVAVINAKQACFEEFGSLRTITHLLPEKPKTSVATERYSTLMGVVSSVWDRVCHIYVNDWHATGQGMDGELVQELHCFNVNGTRAHFVWIDIDLHMLETMDFNNIIEVRTKWATVMATTMKKNTEIDLVFCDYDWATGDKVYYTFTVEGDNNVHGNSSSSSRNINKYNTLYRKCSTPITRRIKGVTDKQENETEQRKRVHIPGLYFEKSASEPYSTLFKVTGADPFFILLTSNGGRYSAFYRYLGNGVVTSYPLYKHIIEETDAERLRKQKQCRVCKRDNAKFNDIDMSRRPDGTLYVYCSSECVEEMISVQSEQEEQQRRRQREDENRRKQIPLFKQRQCDNDD